MAVHQLQPDGSVRAVDEICVSTEDPGFVRGESVFETMTVVGGRALMLDAHLDRLGLSAAALEIALPARSALEELAGAASEESCVLRLVVTRGGNVVALTSPVVDHSTARSGGITAVTLSLGIPAALRAESPWLLGGAKCTSYSVAMAGKREAERRGADDAIWLSLEDEVLEATTSNVAWVADGVLITPPAAEVGILAGTTMAWALDACDVPVVQRRGHVEELLGADEVLVTSSVRGVCGVTSVDGRTIGPAGRVGPVTRRLVDAFEALVG
jgi:4-amino-4-deoxychorismate lyase